MADNREGFDLNRLDQQIEYPAGALDVQASQLVEDLHQMYQASPAASHANAESLRRVQQRLQVRFEPEHQETKIIPLRVTQTHQERKSFMIDKTSERKPGWRRVSRTFNTLAAVLVVAVLIGSAAVLANLKNHAQSSRLNTQVGAALATATPLPKLDCLYVFTQDNGLYPDNGEHAVCTQGLETPLQETTTLGGHKLTLISAYADTNRLLIAYVVSGKDLSRYDGGAGISQLLIQDPAQTIRLGQQYQQDAWSIGGGYVYDAQKNQTAFLESFPTQQVVSGVTSLKVTADFAAINGATSANPAGTSEDTASFTFTLPLYIQRRVATPNQSIVINGHRLTLTQVVVTPSATSLYVKTDQALTPSAAKQEEEKMPSATINGTSNVDGSFTTNGIVNGKWDPVTGFSLGVLEDWMSQPTNWTMALQSSGQPIGNGSGTMQFTVPPAA